MMMVEVTSRSFAESSLRLFRPSDIGHGELSPDMSLSEFYHAYFARVWFPAHRKSPLTVDEYDTSIKYWSRITGDPAIRLIDAFTGVDFLAGLYAKRGLRRGETMAVDTVAKHARQINTILGRTGPRGRGRYDRQNANLLVLPPIIEVPDGNDDPVDVDFTLSEISAMLSAVSVARLPKIPGVTPAAYWRALLLSPYLIAMRIGALQKLQYDWLQEKFGRIFVRLPGRSGRGQSAENVQKKGRAKLIEVPPDLLAVWESIRTSRTLIFPWPHAKNTLYDELHRIQSHAGIPLDRQFGFHSLRASNATQNYEHNGAEAARLSLGHGRLSTTIQHYVNAAIVGRAAERLPRPKPCRGQKPLFE